MSTSARCHFRIPSRIILMTSRMVRCPRRIHCFRTTSSGLFIRHPFCNRAMAIRQNRVLYRNSARFFKMKTYHSTSRFSNADVGQRKEVPSPNLKIGRPSNESVPFLSRVVRHIRGTNFCQVNYNVLYRSNFHSTRPRVTRNDCVWDLSICFRSC